MTGETVKAEGTGVQINNTPLPVGETKKLNNGDKLQIGKANYELNLPADAQSTLGALQRTAVMEFRWLRNVKNTKNPSARYRMEVIPGTEGEADTIKFFDAATNKLVDHKEVLAGSELIVTGKDLKPVSKQDFDPVKHDIVVHFEFKSEGAEKFAEFTRNHVGDYLAIVLDDVVISAPNIESPIEQGSGQISGGFRNVKEARLLAQLLNAGSLPVPLKEAYTSQVGATLGRSRDATPPTVPSSSGRSGASTGV